MLRFQVFFRLLSLWALLLAPELASARTAVPAETRVGVFEVAAGHCIRVSALANSNGHQENVDASTENASRYPQAARGGAEVASSAAQGAKLARQLAAEEIAGGHAFAKHAGQFPGVTTPGQFAKVVEGVMENASHVRSLSGGRTAFWKDGVVVIRNPGAVDGGTAFVPTNGFQYFQGLR